MVLSSRQPESSVEFWNREGGRGEVREEKTNSETRKKKKSFPYCLFARTSNVKRGSKSEGNTQHQEQT